MDPSLLLKYPYVKKQLGSAIKPEEIFDGSYRTSRNFDPPPVFDAPTLSVFPPAVGGPAKGGGSWRNGNENYPGKLNVDEAAKWKAHQDAKEQKYLADQAAMKALQEQKKPKGRVLYH